MTLPEPSPLTAEEKALAQRMSRLGPHAEPSPTLDARILAAAHAAAQAPAARSIPRPRRWPAIVGIAASMVLAVGIAWRLRPLPEAPPTHPVAASRMVVPPTATVAPAQEPMSTRDGDENVAQPPTAQVAEPAAEARIAVPPPRETAPSIESGNSTAAAKASVEHPSPMTLPPPPPAPPEPMFDRVEPARAAAPPAPPAEAVAPQESAGANEAKQAEASDATRQSDEPSDEVPPATVGSPEVRDAWLQRIRGLVEAGDIAGARASLLEFERRYPDYALPEDLRALGR
jgi:hypothetical protein